MTQAPLSLHELNMLVRRVLERNLEDSYWVRAELSELRVNKGHCYVEFVQKSDRDRTLVAKARGVIWHQVFALLKPYFEQATGQPLQAGIKVLVRVQVNFHELYGYTLTVNDIDPSYTLGDMARRRREILLQLQQEGVCHLNKQLEMPELPQRVAVVASASSAGYGDFVNQLRGSSYGKCFRVELFQAVMQGDGLERSVLDALDRIYSRAASFDVVVIIRGGGATSDLSGFDSYPLAAACAQFPLPIITGIGHDRDETVLDQVAHVRVKTPTAAAEYLIGRAQAASGRLDGLRERLRSASARLLADNHLLLASMQRDLPMLAVRKTGREQILLQQAGHRLLLGARQLVAGQKRRVEACAMSLLNKAGMRVERQRHQLQIMEQRLADASPQTMLQRGYSITFCNGRVLTSATALRRGDELTTRLRDGEVRSVVAELHETE